MKINKKIIDELANQLNYSMINDGIGDDVSQEFLISIITSFFKEKLIDKYVYPLE